MFTGLITGVGRIISVTAIGNGQDARFTIQTPHNEVWTSAEKKLGASIACSGVCLTVIDSGVDWFTVEVSAETLSKTSLVEWLPGTPVNLEGSLRLGDELGGHLVSGHVDGLATVISITPENGSTRWIFELPPALAPFVAAKGSIALNGVSLTVNEVEGLRFGVNIIPHTVAQTNFAMLHPASRVNVEIDMLARYLARQLSFKGA
ncbi:MAG: riboflavin synthase [Rhodospirillales bacterium]|nr:riboflavin synthase [Rhodospirillales bacterium]MDE2318923.1 riboflavin synthase [Rhodospirillales bacterium]